MVVSQHSHALVDFVLRPPLHIHIVGVAGSGMSAIARVLLDRGYIVSGSDMQENRFSAELRQLGATIFVGHSAAYISGANLLLRSSAIPDHNPELIAAALAGLPVFKRADFLGLLMEGSFGIAVAGTHGKTTTTSMIASILLEAQTDPTLIIGGVLPQINGNARAGKGDFFVIEADEYDNMFLGLRFTIGVINNVEHDHPDLFANEADYAQAFRSFAEKLPATGQLFYNGDDPLAEQATSTLPSPNQRVSFGLGPDNQWRAEGLRPNAIGGLDFIATSNTQLVGLFRLRVPGEHNVRNALAAIAVTQTLGIDGGTIRQALAEFGGVGRRFQEMGTVAGITVIDDYAHHPTEIKATLAAARQRFAGRRVWAVWQPHTYTRTKLLLDQFVQSFNSADRVIVLDIYRSRERDTLGIDSAQIAQKMAHPFVQYIGPLADAAAYILDRLAPDDVVILLGAGDGNHVGELILEGLENDERYRSARTN